MNIMYFKLKKGEESLPLRDMALENFPNVNLYETDIQADCCTEKAVLYNIISNIGSGNYNKLYIKSLSELSRSATETINIMNEIGVINPDFEIELKDGTIIKPLELSKRLSFAVNQIVSEFDSKTELDIEELFSIKDERESGIGGIQGM